VKPIERDDLLIRLDERTNNIWRIVEALETHNREQNGYIKQAIETCNKNTVWRKAMTGIISVLFACFLTWLILLTML